MRFDDDDSDGNDETEPALTTAGENEPEAP